MLIKKLFIITFLLLFASFSTFAQTPQYREEILKQFLTLKLKDGSLEGTLVTPTHIKRIPVVLIA